MKRLSIILLLFCVNLSAYSQVIKGKIVEKGTNNPIEAATVYLNGTFIGTNCDTDGNFSLDISRYPTMPLSVSAMGYYSATLVDFSKDNPLIIQLAPKSFELNAIVVKAKSLQKERKANLILFKREFLGRSGNAKDCKILNENDILFDYSKNNEVLNAYSKKPLIIDNKSLGYKLMYFLDKFEFSKYDGRLYFVGNIVFKEDDNLKKSRKRTYEKQRKNTYLGSRMHLMRALWMDKLKSNGFKIYGIGNKSFEYKDIVVCDEFGNKFLRETKYFRIEYKNKMSHINFLKDSVYFDKEGYFYPLDILWRGKMSDQRISDFLPYEYSL